MTETRTYTQFMAQLPLKARLRDVARDVALRGLARGKHIDATNNWIRFPFYHHVFEDERKGFHRQLNYLSDFGDFISLDDALSMLVGDSPIDGRYFCVTFDDGLSSCAWGAAPILTEMNAPAAFYIVSNMVGQRLDPDSADARKTFGFKGANTTLNFMSWNDLQLLSDAGFTIGSHTAAHARLADLDRQEAHNQLAQSKSAIEQNLNQPCLHFCPPYGLPDVHFNADRERKIARDLGYTSLVTGARGQNRAGTDPYFIKRDHLLANWGLHQVRYFLSLD